MHADDPEAGVVWAHLIGHDRLAGELLGESPPGNRPLQELDGYPKELGGC